MQYADPTFLVLSLAGIVYLVMFVVILRTRSLREHAVRLLQIFLLASIAWIVSQSLLRLTLLGLLAGFDTYALERIGVYLLLMLAVLFYKLTCLFERREGSGLYGWIVGAVFLAVGVVVYENLLGLPDFLMQVGESVIVRWLVGFAILVVGWGLYMGGTVVMTANTYRRVTSPLHKNRNKYWSLAVVLAVIGQGLLLARAYLPGTLLQLLAVISAAFVLLTFNLPDLRLAARKSGVYLVMTVITVLLYTGGFYVAQALFKPMSTSSPLLVGLVLAIGLAALLNPLLGLVQRFIHRLIVGFQYDASRTLSEYSMSISNILEMELLATVVVGLISEAMEITHGALITTSYQEGENPWEENSGTYLFRSISGVGQVMPESRLAARNPVAYYLRRERQPLTQYDIDLLPRFRSMESDERAWVSSLKMDVYVPIYAKDEWIGILALGPKISGDRYFDEDLMLLKTLADQTAVALENARLYQNLKDRNADNERLNLELKTANQELARLDQAKSDFINIASHELRTPLTQVIGYNDILGEMLKGESLQPAMGAQMIGSVRKAARRLEEIVDTMFDVSKLDTHTLDLMQAPVSLASILSVSVDHWKQGMDERNQTHSVRGLANLPTILADGKRLGQVFSNLIQNAIKSTPDGGQVRVVGRTLEDENSHKQFIEITVADTGIGIAAEDLERIFDKFYRVGNVLLHSTGNTKFKGAGPGLGLTIARGIVDAHGGRMWAESSGHDEETCPGAKFHVLLPVRRIEDIVSAQSIGSISTENAVLK